MGKSSVIDAVRDRTGASFSVSATTRSPRPGEVDGEDYWFVENGAFSELVASGGMLEWAEYGGYRYGTPRARVIETLTGGDHVILDIENEGAHQVKEAYPSAVLVFLMPPSRAERWGCRGCSRAGPAVPGGAEQLVERQVGGVCCDKRICDGDRDAATTAGGENHLVEQRKRFAITYGADGLGGHTAAG